MWMLNMIQGRDAFWLTNLDNKKIRGYLKLFLRCPLFCVHYCEHKNDLCVQ